MEDRYFYFLLWSALWAGILNIPPGSMTITASYRLNFLHGLIASIVAAACLLGERILVLRITLFIKLQNAISSLVARVKNSHDDLYKALYSPWAKGCC